MIHTKGSWFIDEKGRVVLLRGVNLGGSTKVPKTPDGATYILDHFFDHRNVSFTGRPFPLVEADEHFSRLRSWGFNCLRFLITWEAVEHSGPGIYDMEYLEYLHAVIKKAGEYGFYVFIDPHQDVWSRFSGGDGAPGWTLEAAGFDISKFKETGAAIVHQTHGDPFPRMIWPTNAYKLAAGTMFALFFAGNDFAPKTKIGEKNIQDYLQDHYRNALGQVAVILKDLDCVIGFDTLNEPQSGFVGIPDLNKRFGDLEMGVYPTPWQSIQLGAGFTQTVDILERTIRGTHKKGSVQVNCNQVRAWLPSRKCIWQENGVWDFDEEGKPVLLRSDHFASVQGKQVEFVRDYLKPFLSKVAETIHSVKKDWLVFIESEVGQPPPDWKFSNNDHMAYAPHWYDGISLLFKSYSPSLGYDVYSGRVVLGKRAVERSFNKQLGHSKELSAERLGNIPTLIGEIGIPFDMQQKKAYQSGNFWAQNQTLNRSLKALEANVLSFTLWNYTADNTNERGDKWNDEDLSLFSRDQQVDPKDLNSGGRALDAVIRPYPKVVAGVPLSVTFDYQKREFCFRFRSNMDCVEPTEIYCPNYQFPEGVIITCSDGIAIHFPAEQIVRYTPGNSVEHSITFKPKK